MKQKQRLGAMAALLGVALILLVTACGGEGEPEGVAALTGATGQSSSDGDGSSPAGERDREEAALEFAKCMREHGVDFPDPVEGRLEFGGDPGEVKAMEAAQKACRHFLEDAAPPLDEEQQAEIREAALDFAKCMREHGVDMPDPKIQEGGGVLQEMPEGAADDPDLEDAQKACQPILDESKPAGAATVQGKDA